MPGVGMFHGLCHDEEGYGAQLKKRARRSTARTSTSPAAAKCFQPGHLLRDRSRRRRSVGHPRAAFPLQVVGLRLLQAKDMQETFRAIVETMGGEYRTRTSIHGQYPFGIEEGGKIIHEVGTARMGAIRNLRAHGFCQAHDVKNLFVTDGAPLVTNPDKNPTLTIMALSWRASEYLLQEAKKGNL